MPDAHLTNLGSKGLGEPPIIPIAAAIANAIRDATGADVRSLPITREEMLRALARGARTRQKAKRWSSCGASSLDELDGGLPLAGGTEVVPLLRDGLLAGGRRSSTSADSSRAGSTARRIGAGATLAELEATPRSRTRCARRAGSPRRRSSAPWARSAATCSRRRAAGTGGSTTRAGCTAATSCHARDGEHREHAIFANDFCASAHPSDLAAALLALDATLRTTTGASSRSRELYRLPTEDDRRTTTLEPGEVILELDVPPADASIYLKAMDRKRWAFPLVGVAAARRGDETTRRARRRGADPVAARRQRSTTATPLPGTAYKVEIAERSSRRARAVDRAPMRLLLAALAPCSLLAALRRQRRRQRRRRRLHDDPCTARVMTPARGTRRRAEADAPLDRRRPTTSRFRRTAAASRSGSTRSSRRRRRRRSSRSCRSASSTTRSSTGSSPAS